MSQPVIRLGDLLKEKGLITDQHIHYALQEQRVTGQKLGQVLTGIGIVSEYDLIHALAEQLQLPHISLEHHKPDMALLQRFHRQTCLQLRMLPLHMEQDHVLVATSNLPGPEMEQACLRFCGARPQFVLTEESAVVAAIYNYFFFLENPVEEILEREARALTNDTTLTVSPDRFVEHLLLFAIKERTSDIHIRPMEHGINVAFRVDGVLRSVRFYPPTLRRVITAIKLMAGMDISEQRLPQDGRWSATLLQRKFDVRVSSVVTPYGENLVLRLLAQGRANLSLRGLGFLPQDIGTLERAFNEPFGVILLTGPTGSGKSTTLVAGLSSLDLLGKNVLTIENPIEYIVPLARQTQVNEAAGYDFANAMRYFLRHDPDIILIGEMRDELTAKTAITAATTGHLVLSTLHSNTALGAIPRLRGLGLDSLSLAESLVAVVSQRLVRTICPHCQEEYTPSEDEVRFLGVRPARLLRGRGCPACGISGYLGRTLVYEILMVTPEVRRLLEAEAPLAHIEATLREQGFRSMFQVGVEKTVAGRTTVEELMRVLGTTRYTAS
jgi:type II secretory ATPase GspE/PulE/Tfp pilus assembly ATPase PilB-like protein